MTSRRRTKSFPEIPDAGRGRPIATRIRARRGGLPRRFEPGDNLGDLFLGLVGRELSRSGPSVTASAVFGQQFADVCPGGLIKNAQSDCHDR